MISDFAGLTDPAAASKLLRAPMLKSGLELTDCRILHADYKTFAKPASRGKTSLTISYELTLRDRHLEHRKEIFHGKAYLGTRSEDEFVRCRSSSPLHVAEAGLLLWRFPEDDGLPQLSRLCDPACVRGLLPPSYDVVEQPSVVNYRPGKRCVLRYRTSGGVAYAKTYCDDSGVLIAERLRGFESLGHDAGFRTPRLLSYDASLRTLFVEGLEGRTLLEVLSSDSYGPLMSQVAAGLRQFQASGVPAETRITAADHLEEARKKCGKLTRALPGLERRLRRLVCTLEDTAPADVPIVLVHGDFHAGQLLVDNAGGIALFDFDELSYSDPAFDVANFVADLYGSNEIADHVLRDAVAAALSVASRLPPHRFRWHFRVQLLTRAYRFWLKQVPDVEARTEALIARALVI